jgi:hypothetical protein
MNGRMVWRVMWKEYRALRGLWIAVLVGSWLAQLVAILVERQFSLLEIAYGAALVTPVFYVFGAAAAVFAGEREDGTDRLLAGLPLALPPLAAGKLAFVVLSTLAIIPAAGALALGAFWWPAPDRASPWTSTGGLEFIWAPAILEGIAWGLFFSLLLRNVMQAACLAALAAAATVSLALHFSNDTAISGVDPQQYAQTLVARLAIVVVVLVVDLALARKWLREPTEAEPSRLRSGLAVAWEGLGRALARFGQPLRWQGRLTWQHLRQSSGTLLLAAAVPLVLGGLTTSVSEAARLPEFSAQGVTRVDLAWEGPLIFAAALIGCATVVGDKRRRGYRCLAEQGSGAFSLWANRQVLGLLALALAVALWHVVWWLRFGDERPVATFQPLDWRQGTGTWNLATWRELGAAGVAYAAGQAASLFLGSGVVATLVGLVLAGALYGWTCLMMYLALPSALVVWPLTLGLLAATAVFASRWLCDRREPGTWLRAAGTFATFGVAVLAMIPELRLLGVPNPELGFDLEAFLDTLGPEARKTADLYLRALDLLERYPANEAGEQESAAGRWKRVRAGVLSARDRSWLDLNQPALRLIEEANARPTCAFTEIVGERPHHESADLRLLLVSNGLAAEVDGRLDLALERYSQALRLAVHLRPSFHRFSEAQGVERDVLDRLLGWSVRPSQTPERLARARALLEQHLRQVPPSEEPLQWEYVRITRTWERDEPRNYSVPFDGLLASLPWERERARRLLTERINQGLELVGEVTRNLDSGTGLEFLQDRLLRPFPNLQALSTPALREELGWWDADYLVAEWTAGRAARFRAVQIVLELVAVRQRSGRLPDSLEELVGPGFPAIPLDPFTGRAFEYYPRGFPLEFAARSAIGVDTIRTASLGRPLLWSPGPYVRIRESQRPDEQQRAFLRFDGRGWPRVNDLEAYVSGLSYFIPPLADSDKSSSPDQ